MKLYIALLLVVASLSGCSLIYSYDSNITQRVKQWIKEENYIIALDTIKHIGPTHPHYRILQTKKIIILQRLNKLEQRAIKDSNILAKQGEWLLALKRIDETAKKIVNQRKLTALKVTLLNKRSRVIHRYEYKHLNSQARYLASKMSLYEKIRKTVKAEEENQFDILEFDRLRSETSLMLLEQAERQYKSKKHTSSVSSINLALSLKPNKATTFRLNRLNKLIYKANKRKQAAYINSSELLLNKLTDGYSYKTLKEVKSNIEWFRKNKENEQKILVKKLEEKLKLGTKHYFNTARKLYSVGEIEEALDIWLKLKEIAPNYPKLSSHIQRATKILKKLKRLSNKKQEK